jgi:hypothetical protein
MPMCYAKTWLVSISNLENPTGFCAFRTPDGKRRFKSTGTDNKRSATKICAGWVKTAELTVLGN